LCRRTRRCTRTSTQTATSAWVRAPLNGGRGARAKRGQPAWEALRSRSEALSGWEVQRGAARRQRPHPSPLPPSPPLPLPADILYDGQNGGWSPALTINKVRALLAGLHAGQPAKGAGAPAWSPAGSEASKGARAPPTHAPAASRSLPAGVPVAAVHAGVQHRKGASRGRRRVLQQGGAALAQVHAVRGGGGWVPGARRFEGRASAVGLPGSGSRPTAAAPRAPAPHRLTTPSARAPPPSPGGCLKTTECEAPRRGRGRPPSARLRVPPSAPPLQRAPPRAPPSRRAARPLSL
jgi:hypothetical protein